MNSQNTLFRAIEFANWAHRNQKRKLGNAPYIMHPFHVILLLLSHGVRMDEQKDLIVLTAGALHNTLEDNPEEVTLDLIEKEFGIEVAQTVNYVTLDPSNPDKRLSRQKILNSDWMTRIVKVADILSNTIATTDSIKRVGFEEVQKCFKQTILGRIEMERDFLKGAYCEGESKSLLSLQVAASTALTDLESVTEN